MQSAGLFKSKWSSINIFDQPYHRNFKVIYKFHLVEVKSQKIDRIIESKYKNKFGHKIGKHGLR